MPHGCVATRPDLACRTAFRAGNTRGVEVHATKGCNMVDGAEQILTVQDLVEVVNRAIADAQTRLRGAKMALTQVDLKLAITYSKGVGASGEWLSKIVSAGVDLSDTDVHTVSLSLVPPQPKQLSRLVGEHDLAQDLSDAIGAISWAVALGKGSEPPLELKEAKADVTFTVTKSGNLKIFAGGQVGREAVQSVALTFGPEKSAGS